MIFIVYEFVQNQLHKKKLKNFLYDKWTARTEKQSEQKKTIETNGTDFVLKEVIQQRIELLHQVRSLQCNERTHTENTKKKTLSK